MNRGGCCSVDSMFSSRVSLFRRSGRSTRSLDAELPGVLRVEPLPAVALHGRGAGDASNGLAGQVATEDSETEVPACRAHRDEASGDVVPEGEPGPASERLQLPADVLPTPVEFEEPGRVGPLHGGFGDVR